MNLWWTSSLWQRDKVPRGPVLWVWHQLWRGLEVLIWQTLHLKWSDLISCYKVWSHVSNYYTKLYRFLSVVHKNILRSEGIGSQSAVSWIIAMVTMPIHIWLPGAAWHHRRGQESDNERTWDWILGQARARSGRYNLSSQGWSREDIGILVRSHCHLHYRGWADQQPHYDTGCSLQHEFYAFGENLTKETSSLKVLFNSSEKSVM